MADVFGSLRRPPEYRAPSWSWGSLDGGVNNTPRETEDVARLKEYSITPAELDPNGEVEHDWITMNGPFLCFPELRSHSQISVEIQKLDICNDKGANIGGAFLNTFDRSALQPSWTPSRGIWIKGRAVEAFGLQTKVNAGVIVACSAGSKGAYERLGILMLNADGEHWVGVVAEQMVKII